MASWLPAATAAALLVRCHGSGAARLAQLTATAESMEAHEQELYDNFCPACDENPGVTLGITQIGGMVFVMACGLLVGTDVTLDNLTQVLKRKKRGFVVGMLSQFGFMPLYATLVSHVFRADLTATAYHSYEAATLGLIVVGSLPGGTTSNLFTWFVGGNVPLSVMMSLFSTVMACGALPLLILLYYETRFDSDDAPGVPYGDVLLPLILTVVTLGMGMLIKRFGGVEIVWWVQKISSLFAIFFLFLAVVIGCAKYPHVMVPKLSLYWACFTIQPMGYAFGWGFAKLFRCSLKDQMTIAFETGVQSFTLGMVIASLGFNSEKETCQFAPDCMRFLGESFGYGDKYGYALNGGGRIPEGNGEGKVSVMGFLPGAAATGAALGGCCRPNEMIWLDVWKFSALCGVLYPLHAWWMTAFLRKIFPDGFQRRKELAYDEEGWPKEAIRKPNTATKGSDVIEGGYPPEGSYGSESLCRPRTLTGLLEMAAGRVGHEYALAYEEKELEVPKGSSMDAHYKMSATASLPWSQWKRWTWTQYLNDVNSVAAGFIAMGLQDFGSVCIYGFNTPHWNISAMAAMFAGGKAAGIYPTDTAEQVAYKVHHSGAAVTVIEDNKKLRHVKSELDKMPGLQGVVVYREKPEVAELKRTDGTVVKLYFWDDVLALGSADHIAEVEKRKAAAVPGKPACLVYTSGTTGYPKAVMHSHDNLVFSAMTLLKLIEHRVGVEYDEDRILSYLPLSHIAGFGMDIVDPIVGSALKKGFFTVYFARPYDLKEGTLRNRLVFVRPHLFMGVPRVWEKFAEALQEAGKKVAALKGMKAQMPILCCIRKRTVGLWAKRHGLESMRNRNVGGSGKTTGMYGLADALVLSRVRAQLGLDCVKFAVTAAAPIGRDTLEFLGAYGLIVTEAYGMSESCGCASFSTDDRFLWGSCGFPMPGTQVKIFRCNAEDMNKKVECPKAKDVFQPTEEEQGEICYRGRHVMMGYLANPALGDEHVKQAEQQTKDTIDDEGWLHSGDMGVFGVNGMLRITGRYKELIITAGGENIAPVPIEENVLRLCPHISFAMMLGDKRKFNTMLITLKADGDKLVGEAAAFVAGVTLVSQAKEHPEFLKAVEKAIADTNNDSKICPSNASRVQKFRILPLDFSVENDELTPTLKLKRKNVEKKYCRTIEGLYADGTEKPTVDTAKSDGSKAQSSKDSETTAATAASVVEVPAPPKEPAVAPEAATEAAAHELPKEGGSELTSAELDAEKTGESSLPEEV